METPVTCFRRRFPTHQSRKPNTASIACAMRGRTELLYGLVGLFLVGLGIRAVFNVTS